jgi:hypothetical protein
MPATAIWHPAAAVPAGPAAPPVGTATAPGHAPGAAGSTRDHARDGCGAAAPAAPDLLMNTEQYQ